MKSFLKKFRSRKKLVAVFSVISVVVFGGIVWRTSHPPDPQLTNKDGVVVYSTNKPDEKKPDSDYKWRGADNDPKKIIISSIGVDAYIQKVGKDQNNQVAVPSNLFTVGWFVDTVRPSEKGLSLIDGHVTGRQNDGIFKDLDKLNEGDTFKIELGNGISIKYQVIGKQSVKVKDSVSAMFSQSPQVSNQLNLVTCSGKFDKNTRTYDERLIVLSKQL